MLVRGAAQLVAALKAQGCLLSSLIAVCSVLHHHLCWHLREGMCCKAQQTGFDVHACSSLTNNRKRLRLQECTGQQRTHWRAQGTAGVELAQQFWRLLQEPLLRPQKAPNLPPQQQQRQRRERQAPSWMLSTVRCRDRMDTMWRVLWACAHESGNVSDCPSDEGHCLCTASMIAKYPAIIICMQCCMHIMHLIVLLLSRQDDNAST